MESIEKDIKENTSNQSLSSYEMGRDDVNVICTYGKIAVWFGRQTPEVVVGRILISISRIDKSAVHEVEIVCPFEKITEYESHGYVLVSYAKCEGGYRATFHIPFYNKKALFFFAEHIVRKLQQRDVKIDIYWNGDDSDITRLTEHLEEIDDWKVKKINYKDNSKEKQEK